MNDSARRPTVMIVDDEEIVTRSISTLLTLETDYRVLTFQSPQAALEAARREHLDCVITDFLMPGMDGLGLLRELKSIAPDVPAILLTGYADKESAIAAVNEVNLFQYLEKPWENDHLRIIIRNAINHHTLESALTERLRELDRVVADRDSLRLSTEQLEQELVLAEQVQRSILPREICCDGRFRFYYRYFPTGRLGGDYFDVIATGEDRFNCIVSDVAGHGVAAALGTMLVKVVFSFASQRGDQCADILSTMNQRLVELLTTQQYVTAFMLRLDAFGPSMTAAAAGGPHPIIIPAANPSPVVEWRLNGLPLGAFNDKIFRPPEAQSKRLDPGDRVLMYTDGLLDVNIDHGESFDPSEIVRTVETLRGREGDDFLDRLVTECGVDRPNLPDDVNLLLIEYVG